MRIASGLERANGDGHITVGRQIIEETLVADRSVDATTVTEYDDRQGPDGPGALEPLFRTVDC